MNSVVWIKARKLKTTGIDKSWPNCYNEFTLYVRYKGKMIVVNTSNEISTDISARVRLFDGLLRQHSVARVSINKLTLTYILSLIVLQLSIAYGIAGN